jgi:hypothetical protein
MLRTFLSGIDVLELPIVAMGIFIFLFAAVLLRVSKKARAAEYKRMAALPLEDDARRA